MPAMLTNATVFDLTAAQVRVPCVDDRSAGNTRGEGLGIFDSMHNLPRPYCTLNELLEIKWGSSMLVLRPRGVSACPTH